MPLKGYDTRLFFSDFIEKLSISLHHKFHWQIETIIIDAHAVVTRKNILQHISQIKLVTQILVHHTLHKQQIIAQLYLLKLY